MTKQINVNVYDDKKLEVIKQIAQANMELAISNGKIVEALSNPTQVTIQDVVVNSEGGTGFNIRTGGLSKNHGYNTNDFDIESEELEDLEELENLKYEDWLKEFEEYFIEDEELENEDSKMYYKFPDGWTESEE